jgi:DNA-binding HxlR family transcriptional regulator
MTHKRRSTGSDLRSASTANGRARMIPWSLELSASVLCKRWKPGILWLLLAGCTRFGELSNGLLQVSSKMLTQQLRELERDGLVRRLVAERGSHRVTYSLTETGRQLALVLEQLSAWGVKYYQAMPSSVARHGLTSLMVGDSEAVPTTAASSTGSRAD